MLRPKNKLSTEQDPDFHWRGGDVSRIENLSDIVFALSLSLLAVASAPPATYAELIGLFKGVFAFAFAFAILLLIWNYHYIYFRRYGLKDQGTVFLNALLLFLVLLFVYPLRFLADFIFVLFSAMFSGPDRIVEMVPSYDEGAMLLVIYSIGYAAVFLVIAALYGHAAKMREVLELSDKEMMLTRKSRASAIAQASVALFVAAVAWLTPVGPWAGPLYFLIGPVVALTTRRYKTPA